MTTSKNNATSKPAGCACETRLRRLAEEDAVNNPVSLLLFHWVSPLFKVGWERYKEGRTLQIDDLLELPEQEGSKLSHDQFKDIWAAWQSENSSANASKEPAGDDAATPPPPHQQAPLLKLLARSNKKDLLIGAIYRVIQDVGNVASPFILRALILWLGRYAFFGEAAEPTWRGFLLAFALAVNNFVLWVCTNMSLFYTNKAFGRMRSAMMMAVYEKTLRLDRSLLVDVGKIQQMHASDTYKFVDMSVFMHSLWAGPLVFIAALISIVIFVGWAGLLALAILIIVTPSQGRITNGMMMIRRHTMKYADARIQAVNEFCQGIRIIKFMCWESSTIQNVMSIRGGEVAQFGHLYKLRSIMITTMFSTPLLVSLAVFGVAYAIGDPVKPENIFPTMAMINVLRQPLLQLPLALARIVDCNVGLARINTYLDLPEKDVYVEPLTDLEKETYAVVVENIVAVYEEGAQVPRGGRGGGSKARGAASDGPSSPRRKPGEVEPVTPAPSKPKIFKPYMGPVSLAIPKGKLTMIIGSTGSGKSTLLDMMIGEALIDRTNNNTSAAPPRAATLVGDVAYMTQEAWIMNATVKANIVMGSDFDEDRYVEAVNVCQLIPDLEQLNYSDATEIGERGINISGGQKQRVAFARALYSNRSVVLMDDPLSAVDSHVCTALFRDCIQGAMKHKSRVLVTHQVQFLPEADHIVVVDKCQIVFQGSYEELLASGLDIGALTAAASSPVAAAEIAAVSSSTPMSGAPSTAAPPTAPHHSKQSTGFQPIPLPKSTNQKQRQLMQDEHQVQGTIKWTTMVWYLRNQGYGMVACTFFAYMFAQLINVLTSLILSWWSGRTPILGHTLTNEQYIMYYGIFSAGSIATMMLQTVPFNRCMLNCARGCHEAMLTCLLRCPTSYFDTTPVGRILSRFSKDLDNMDQQIPWTLGTVYQLLFTILGSIGIIAYTAPYMLIAMGVLGIVFCCLFTYYAGTNRAQKRLEAVNRTPMTAIMNETLGGLPTLRAYHMIPYYQKKHEIAADLTSRSTYNWRLSQRWLSVRVQLITAATILSAGLLFCGLIVNMGRQEAIENLPLMALSLTNAMMIAGYLGMLTNISTELESAMSSVERTKEFCDELPQERDVVYDDSDDGSGGASEGQHNEAVAAIALSKDVAAKSAVVSKEVFPALPQGWPSTGELQFEHASLRYRNGLPLVLQDLTFVVPHGSKVGVVGRTGSGKSTLMLALFRVVELSQRTGSPEDTGRILLDGRDIATVKLFDLRSRITIIPQDPLLFAGTIRSNVDPFSQCTDERVWTVIRHVGLGERVERSGDGLNCPVSERGSNFSVGQRQLICLARALLKECRLLLLDEATASVDQETDAMIQKTIRESFQHCTVLTIAHRLQTIMDSDKVLVMDKGRVVEYDSPYRLLAPTMGETGDTSARLFRSMVDALGPEQAALMHSIAKATMEKQGANC